MREEIFTRYYADDGSVFNTKEECEAYEKNVGVNLEEMLPDMYLHMKGMIPPFYRRVSYIKDTLPFPDGGITPYSTKYEWFALKTPEDYRRLEEAIPKNSKLARNLYDPKAYPEVIAIESSIPLSLMCNQKKHKYTGRYAYVNREKEKISEVFRLINEALKYSKSFIELEIDDFNGKDRQT